MPTLTPVHTPVTSAMELPIEVVSEGQLEQTDSGLLQFTYKIFSDQTETRFF